MDDDKLFGLNFGIIEFAIRMYLFVYSIMQIISTIEKDKKKIYFLVLKLFVYALFIMYLLLDSQVSLVNEVLDFISIFTGIISLKMVHIITPLLMIILILTNKKNFFFVTILFNIFYTDIAAKILGFDNKSNNL